VKTDTSAVLASLETPAPFLAVVKP